MRKPWRKLAKKRIRNTELKKKQRIEKASYAGFFGPYIDNDGRVKDTHLNKATKYRKKVTNKNARRSFCASGGYYKKTFGYDLAHAMS